MPEFEKPLWLFCIYQVPRVHALELERSLRLFCSISESYLGLHWGVSRVGLRDQLASLSAKPPLIAYA